MRSHKVKHCYVDESIHEKIGTVAISFIFTREEIDDEVRGALIKAGIDPLKEEYKSSYRMDKDMRMKNARANIMRVVVNQADIAVFFGPFERVNMGRQTLQALQSIIIRNGIEPDGLNVYCDEEMFSTVQEAERIHQLFHSLNQVRLFPREKSHVRRGIQMADAVANCFGQIIKEEITGKAKMVDIGGPDTGYAEGTEAALGWELLMGMRYTIMSRPVIQNGEPYNVACDPVVIDPMTDDPVMFGQNPVILGWGIQVAPEAGEELRSAVQRRLATIWLGCIH